MKLREYQAKGIFAERGFRVPEGALARTPDEAAMVAAALDRPVVLKPQLGVKGRGKAGGIRFADDPAAAADAATDLFAMSVRGEPVRVLLVEEKLPIESELYLAVTVDYAARAPVIVASDAGGVDVEEVARTDPGRILRVPVDILTGPSPAAMAPVREHLGDDVADHAVALYSVFREYDAELAEINPIVRVAGGALVAADAVLNVNPDSVFRHDDLLALREEIPPEDPFEDEARDRSWTWIRLGGDVGILSSGAGLTMAILDLIQRAGGSAANFLDTAQIDDEGIFDAFDLLARAGGYRALLVNIFAGLNRCDLLAEGIRRYLAEHPLGVPVVVRMVGNQEEEGHRILRECGVAPYSGLEDAVTAVVAAAGGAA